MTKEDIIQYMNNRKQACKLEIMDTITGKRRVLKKFNRVIEAPNWTKDGNFLIYNSQGLIYKYNIRTGQESQMDTGFASLCNNDHVLSPDDKYLAVSHMTEGDFQSRIYIIPIEGGSPKLVTQEGGSYLHGWSPDGKELAFCGARDNIYDIYTIDIEGKKETRLTFTQGLDDGPEYSVDGKKIWFNSTRTGLMQVWKMDRDGGNQERVTNQELNCWFPHVSPNNDKVVYIAYEKGDVDPLDHPADRSVSLRIMDIDGSNDRQLAAFEGGQGTINVNSWAPDSRRIAYVVYEE